LYLAPQNKSGFMNIFDMNGKQIDKYPLNSRGENYLQIHKGRLTAGMYYYTLIADGKEIATKKMILTN
jgi:hypothetical protein